MTGFIGKILQRIQSLVLTLPKESLQRDKAARSAALALSALLSFPAIADVNLAVQVNSGSATPGSAVIVTATVSNDGASPETDLSVEMIYPAGMASISEALFSGPFNTGASCNTAGFSSSCEATEPAIWDVGTLNPGQSMELTLAPIVLNSTLDGTVIVWEATVSNATGDLDTQSASLVVDVDPSLTVSIDEDRDPVPASGTLVYTVQYGNVSGSSVTGTTLDFTLPADTSFVSATGGGVEVGGVVSWNLGDLVAGATGQQKVEVTANAVSNGTLLASEAHISGTQNFALTERRGFETGRVAATGPLAVSLTVNPSPTRAGGTMLVEMRVSNPTASPVFGSRVLVRYPSNVASVSEALIVGELNAGVSCDEDGFSSSCEGREFLVWDTGTINPGQSKWLTLPPIVGGSTAAGTLIGWEARITDDSGSRSFESLTLPVAASPVLTVAIDEDRDPVPAGGTLVYTLEYANASGSSVTATSLDFTLSPGSSFVSASGGGQHAGGVVSWSLGTLPAGAIGRQVVEVTANSVGNGTLLETEALINGTQNFLPTERRALETGLVGPTGPLSVALQVNAAPGEAGDAVLVEMRVSNPTSAPVFGSRVLVRYPGGMASLGEALMQGPFNITSSCDEDGFSSSCEAREFVIWDPGTVNPGQSIVLSMPPIIGGGVAAGSLIQWEARVTDDSGSLSFESTTLPVISSAALTLAIDEDHDPVATGDTLVYTLRYGNVSGNSVSDTLLDFVLPPDTSFVSATGGGQHTGGVVSWNLGTVTAGAVSQHEVEVIANVANSGTLLESEALISGTQNFLPTERRAAEIGRIGPRGPLALGLTVNPLPGLPGATALVQMRLSNPTASPVFGSAIILRYPGNMASLSEALILGGINAAVSCDEDGFSSTCEGREFLRWDTGTINPGQSKWLTLPPIIGGSTTAGTLVGWEALMIEDGGTQSVETVTMPVVGSAALTLAIDDSSDPVAAGDTVRYTLRYGNASGNSVTDTNLAVTLPANATFVSASGGGTVANDVVSWNLGTLSAGDIGQQLIEVTANALSNGSQLESQAVIDGTQNFLPTARRAFETGLIGTTGPLALELSVNPLPGQASDTLSVAMRVSNATESPVFGGRVLVRYPGSMASLNESLIVGPFDFSASCDEDGFSGSCEGREFLIWDFDLFPGEIANLSLPPVVGGSTANGNLIGWHARISDDSGGLSLESSTLPIGTDDLGDPDADGVGNSFDNCLLRENPKQRDSDKDLYGNACDPDIALPNNCAANFLDLGVLKAAFFSDPTSQNWNPDADFDEDDQVNFVDLGVMKALFFGPPGPSALTQVCN